MSIRNKIANDLEASLKGCLMGMAVGDSLGLPVEFLNPEKTARVVAKGLKQSLFWGKGMFSDDTENAAFTAMSLIRFPNDPEKFASFLAWRLRWWLLGVPAGIGFATLRSIFKLWMGFSYKNSGVFSAGNGPAMRSPVIGVAFRDDFAKMADFVKNSTIMTHSDPKAFQGAMIAAIAAALSSKHEFIAPQHFFELVRKLLPDLNDDFAAILQRSVTSAAQGKPLKEFVNDENWQKNGVSGYIVNTMAAVIHVWLRNQDSFESGIKEIIEVGGDTDTTAAILGGIIGARVGIAQIPENWRNDIIDWPRSTSWLEKVASKLSQSVSTSESGFAPYYHWYLVPFRNLFFLVFILLQVIRRIFL